MTTLALAACNTLLIAMLLLSSYLSLPGSIRLSVLDPFVFLAVFLAIYVTDFVVLAITVETGNPSFLNLVRFHFSTEEADHGFALFTLLNASFCLGCFVAAVVRAAPGRPVAPRVLDPAGAEIVLVVLIGAAAVALLWIQATQEVSALLDITMERQNFFRQNLLTYLVLSSTFPAFAIHLSRRETVAGRDLAYFGIVVCYAVLSGSRFYLIFLLVVFVVRFRASLPLRNGLWSLPAIPVLVFGLALMRYVLREQALFSSFLEFLDFYGGIFSLTFRSAEMALAEAFTAVAVSPGLPDRQPLSGALGLILLPLPREIFDFKPFGASAAFTAAITPDTWTASRSEIVIGGYADLLWELGLAPAALACFLAGALFAALVRRCVASRDEVRLRLHLPYLLFVVFIFVRSDIYNLGLILWPLAAVHVARHSARKLLELVLAGRAPSARCLGGATRAVRPG